MNKVYRVLSIDGCGFRGLSSLLALEHLMVQMGTEENPAKPCDVFDLICGTATGGLVAILLGRLGLSCEDTRDAYKKLEETIFGTSEIEIDVLESILNNQTRFATGGFEKTLADLVQKHTRDRGSLMLLSNDEGEKYRGKRTKTLVTVIPSATAADVDASRIRSYPRPPSSRDPNPPPRHKWTICDAARGTSSCPRLFPPLDLAVTGTFQAANASGFSNPSMIAYLEALDLFGNDARIVLISLGMGLRHNEDLAPDTKEIDGVIQSHGLQALTQAMDQRLRTLIQQSQRVATSTEIKHLRLSDRILRSGKPQDYHRLNPTGDSRGMVFVDYGQSQLIEDIWTRWISGDGRKYMDNAVSALKVSVAAEPRFGFPSGSYFLIRARGTNNFLTTSGFLTSEGVQVQVWPRETGGVELRSQAFFIDRTGALCHAQSGHALDIVDDVPVLRHRRPVAPTSNPWSHPLPIFFYSDSQVRVKFLSDPSLPSCTQTLYPNESWRTGDFLLATRSEKTLHMHELSDFSTWIPRTSLGSPPYSSLANFEREWGVLVEATVGNDRGNRILWDIVPAPMS